jgi:hypothetical protein
VRNFAAHSVFLRPSEIILLLDALCTTFLAAERAAMFLAGTRGKLLCRGSQKACARHHLEALFDGSLIAHQIFGEKLMNGSLGMTQLYACSSSECFYSESSTFMDLRLREKKWNAINILRLRNICSCINTDRL